MTLDATQPAILERAHRPTVDHEFEGLSPHWADGRWLRDGNRYQYDCIKRIDKDLRPPRKLRAAHLREYVAASTIPHCMDGWAYLGRALASYLCGDIDAARHLAYYAELRAAMSLLGSEGVGVFSRKNLVIPQTGHCPVVSASGTHVFA